MKKVRMKRQHEIKDNVDIKVVSKMFFEKNFHSFEWNIRIPILPKVKLLSSYPHTECYPWVKKIILRIHIRRLYSCTRQCINMKYALV